MLTQQRPPNTSSAHFWEFPGGKIEQGESPPAALQRELCEEVGITVKAATPWLVRRHYSAQHDTLLQLHFWRVSEWAGQPYAKEGQVVKWCPVRQPPLPILPNNQNIWKWLTLPPTYAISAVDLFGINHTISQLPRLLQQPTLLQIREKNIAPADKDALFSAIAATPKHPDTLIVVNDNKDDAQKTDGLHLSAKNLLQHPTRPDFNWVGASCHNSAELEHAAKIGVDYILLSPVCPTASHPTATPLGWQQFAQLTASVGIPVYALGGLTPADLPTAHAHSGHGIATLRHAWHPGAVIPAKAGIHPSMSANLTRSTDSPP